MRYQKIELTVLFKKEGKMFIAYSPALDISTFANSFEKAKQRFEELVEVFFEELEKTGTLEDVLIECGWTKIRDKDKSKRINWVPPRFITQTKETVQIPCHV